MNFWQQLDKPFFCVAPMADVTDAAFRRLIAKYSKEGVGRAPAARGQQFITWTEFVSADGLVLAPEEGKQKLLDDLKYTDAERPIVAQLFSSVPEHMEQAAALCHELAFDGVDINMGCPDRSIEKQGCGAAMIKTPEVAKEIIRAAKRGASGLPVSVKTRLGYNEDILEEWLPVLLKEEPAAVTIHARTRKNMSKVPARWERVARAVEIRDEMGIDTLIIGNGDVLSLEDGREKAKLFHADGIMVGRALFGNPWFFNESRQLPLQRSALPTHGVDLDTIITADASRTDVEYVTLRERLEVMVEHTKLFCELLPHKNFATMKKHYKAYAHGFAGAKELRTLLMNATDSKEVEQIVHEWLSIQTV